MNEPVVLRNSWTFRLVTLPILALGAILLVAFVSLLARGGPHLGWAGWVIVMPLVLLMGLACVFTGLVGPLMKMSYWHDHVDVRPILVTRRIDRDTMSRIRQVRATVHGGRVSFSIGRLQLIGDESRGLPVRAFVDESLPHAEEAMAILDDWVRRRPELVEGDPPAKDVFVARGVLPAEPSRA